MPPHVDPGIFGWLTTEKAAAIVTIVAAIAAYVVGGRKRDKADGPAAAGNNMLRTHELLEEVLTFLRSQVRQHVDRAEVDHAVHVQIRDELRLLRGDDRLIGDPLPPAPKRRSRTRRKPSAE